MTNIELENSQPLKVIQSALAFSMPRITYGVTDTVLSFYAFDRQVGRLRRKRIKLNHLGKRWFIRRREREICSRFLALLAQGWSPWNNDCPEADTALTRFSQSLSPKERISVKEALQRYADFVDAEVERKVMSKDTRRTYLSYIAKLRAALPHDMYVGDVATADLVAFIDGMKAQNLSPKYCNSVIGWLKTVFGWMMERGPVMGNSKQFGRFWERRVACQGGIYPELEKRGIVFYSLKNSGITDMLQRGVPSAVVRDQARHQDLSTTEIYGRQTGLKAPEGLKDYR